MTYDYDAIEAAIKTDLPEDDELHPLSLLGRWTLVLAEDYGITLPPQLDLDFCARFLDRTLHRLAQDQAQDFPLFAREMRACRNHLEGVLRNSSQPERGAPCPSCETPAPRLTRAFGHWCVDPECDRMHYPEDPDRWVCPRNRDHWWDEEGYRRWVADVYEANRSVGA